MPETHTAGEERVGLLYRQCDTLLLSDHTPDPVVNIILKCRECGSSDEAKYHYYQRFLTKTDYRRRFCVGGRSRTAPAPEGAHLRGPRKACQKSSLRVLQPTLPSGLA
jgi:hypothetical protein